MNIGIPKKFAAASIMAAVLLLGPAAITVPSPSQVGAQMASAAVEQPVTPTAVQDSQAAVLAVLDHDRGHRSIRAGGHR